jgi:ankyrin repeat protein
MLAATGRGCETEEMLELLLRWGADPTIKDVHGNTPLGIASKGHRPDAVRILKGATAKR